jgi:guanosine-3',5'-bis(diphosphate) 3'-pyrophosphohydrolase
MLVTQRTEQAACMAKKAHAGQIDRDGNPHFAHVERVAFLVAKAHGYEQGTVTLASRANGKTFITNCIAAAYLHDTLEDTELTYSDILSEYGQDIANAVLALTRMDGESFEAFTMRCDENPIARVVRLHDMLDNMARIDDKMRKQEKLYLWAIAYLQRA